MFAAMVACKQHCADYLPVVADSEVVLFSEGLAVTHGILGLTDLRIGEMKPRTNFRTGKSAIFLGLIAGIRIEMRAANLAPIEMAKKLLEAAPQFHPDLVQELLPDSGRSGTQFDVILDTRINAPVLKRLAARLGGEWRQCAPRLIIMGRMLAHFVLTGEKLRHFID